MKHLQWYEKFAVFVSLFFGSLNIYSAVTFWYGNSWINIFSGLIQLYVIKIVFDYSNIVDYFVTQMALVRIAKKSELKNKKVKDESNQN
jgi:hypothetical protein